MNNKSMQMMHARASEASNKWLAISVYGGNLLLQLCGLPVRT